MNDDFGWNFHGNNFAYKGAQLPRWWQMQKNVATFGFRNWDHTTYELNLQEASMMPAGAEQK